MSTELVARSAEATFEQVRQAIDSCDSPEGATEVVARVAAARAWASAHGQLRELRLQLLGLEVDALVRVIELGGARLLTAKDRKAGEYLASITHDERMALIRDSGATTTASGMVNRVLAEREEGERQQRAYAAGAAWAAGSRTAYGAIKDEIESCAGRSFEVAEIADAVADEMDGGDESFREGVREMCRTYLRKLPPERIGDTVIPRTITSQLPDGSWVRIPTLNATVGDCLANLAMKDDQLRQDREARDRFADFVSRLTSITSDDTASVADVLAESLGG